LRKLFQTKKGVIIFLKVVKYIGTQYEKYKDNIRKILEKQTFNFDMLLDVDWRLDYVVKTSELENTNEPLYTIKLKLSNGESKTFTCTVSQLQDLYSKLSDATKQIERLNN
jgi:hypothetical protein